MPAVGILYAQGVGGCVSRLGSVRDVALPGRRKWELCISQESDNSGCVPLAAAGGGLFILLDE